MEIIHDQLKSIRAFVFDVDGVMTDGNVIATEDGNFLRNFNIKDGYALQHAAKAGYPIAIISGGSSQGVVKRFQQLGIKDIYVGQQHKETAFNEFLDRYNLSAKEVLYMGDDLPDFELMKTVGFACCPKDAAVDILEICHFISAFPGGKGCVREILEKTMKLQSKWWNNESHTW